MAVFDDTRADWNARPPTRTRTTVAWSRRIGVSWHWIGDGKGPSASAPHSSCLKRVRDWQAQHQDPNGRLKAKDLGYNALICQHGRAIEGRGLTYSGSHSPGVNTVHVGVQFMVGSGDPFPNAAMIDRAVRLRADIAALGQNIRRDWAHRDDPKASTACPGNDIADWVHKGGPTKSTPAKPPAPVQEDDDMAFTVKNPATGVQWSADDALWSIWSYTIDANHAAREAARDAAVARKLAEVLAAKGGSLTQLEIDAIGAAVGEKLAQGFDVELSPKPAV